VTESHPLGHLGSTDGGPPPAGFAQPDPNEPDWFLSEESTRVAMVSELQRIKRRTRVRPWWVLIFTALITFGITYKFASKQPSLEASVTLALAEGAMAGREIGIPVDQLRQYVTSVLLPDKKLAELIENRDLFRLRKKLGMEYATEELRGNITISIWKNSFIFFDEDDQSSRRSARIGITVADADPDRAFDIAHDLASIVMDSLNQQRQKLADEITKQVATLRKSLETRLAGVNEELASQQNEVDRARASGQIDRANLLRFGVAVADEQRKDLEGRLAQIAASNEEMTSQIANAGLDVSMSIVEEYRPEKPTRSPLVFVIIASVIGAGALLASALVFGAFDSRVHDSDDVTRLGLPVLGHVPGFAGDDVGSMQTRSASRARVPSFLRWRSHR
jgi:capsular polysaccharide biosynthesis protein